MQENFKDSLNHVLSHEGGYVNHPRDPGGATNKGITLKVYRDFYGEHLGKEDLRQITIREAGAIYLKNYWDKCKCDGLAAGVDYTVFDQAVNSGPSRSIKWLQMAVGAKADGVLGSKTRAAVAKRDPATVVNAMCDERLAFLRRLGHWRDFGRGWSRRVADVRQQAVKLADGEILHEATSEEATYEITRAGSKGRWVRKLQRALNKHKATSRPLLVDGDFGKSTTRVLKAFQKENGLLADGVAGHNTYQALGLIA
jgi:lysozyme family protein